MSKPARIFRLHAESDEPRFSRVRVPLCRIGSDGRIEAANDAFCRALGRKRSSLIGSPVANFFSDSHSVSQALASALAPNTLPAGSESIALTRRLGPSARCKVRWFRVHGTLHLALGRNLAAIPDAFTCAPIALATLSAEGALLSANPALRSLFGETARKLLGRKIGSLLHPPGAPAPGDYRIRHAGQASTWVRLRSSHSTAESAGQVSWVISLEDITEFKRRETALRASESNLRSLIDATPDLVWTTEPSGRAESFNCRWQTYTGLTETEGRDGGWVRVLHPDDLPQIESKWRECLSRHEALSAECRIREQRTGTFRWHLIRAVPAFDGSGHLVRWYGTGTDIDSQKHVQHELEKSVAKLNRSQRESMALRSRAKAASEASRLKSEFLANMSHEIRTPLNGVIGMSDVLRATELNESQRECAETIAQSAAALMVIVNDILDLSKIEAGHLKLAHAPFELGAEVQKTVHLLEASAKLRGISLNLVLDPSARGRFVGDHVRIQQVLFNLLQNAIKFTENGHVAVRVRHRDENCLRFEVQDTGIGIAPAVIARIFEPFEQADGGITRRFGGTGLGLAICKKLISLMNGTIGVESELGHGSTFWFEISLARSTKRARARSSEGATELKAARVLVVEDHPTNRRVVQRLLENAGHRVDLAPSGKEALTRLAQLPAVDVVVMDCHMPEMDGYQTARAIRATLPEPLRSVPILALTADVLRGTRERCVAAGMNGYLQKPVNTQALLRAISKAMQNGRVRPPTLDPEALQKLEALNGPGQSDIVVELFEDYLEKTPARVDAIQTAIAKADLHEASEAAHSLKSVAALLGAKRLVQVLERIERATSIEMARACERELRMTHLRAMGAVRSRLKLAP